MSSKVLTLDYINHNMRVCRYEVRGEIYLAAVKRAQEGKEVIYLNVGNPQALGQKPLTFNREVMALVMAPFLLDNPQVRLEHPAYPLLVLSQLFYASFPNNFRVLSFLFH
jgi:glutamate--glyoxylate aminotransferase